MHGEEQFRRVEVAQSYCKAAQNVQIFLTIDGLIDNILEPGRMATSRSRASERCGIALWRVDFLKMWALERLDVAEICIVVFVWVRFLLRQEVC